MATNDFETWQRADVLRREQMSENYKRYLREKGEQEGKGEAIGTFSSWQYERNLVDIKVGKKKGGFDE